MRWKLFSAAAVAAIAAGIGVAEIQSRLAVADEPANLAAEVAPNGDSAFRAYVLSLFSTPGKAVEEFQSLAMTSPLLTSYALALFTADRCSTPPASAELIRAAGGTPAFETEAGKRVFAVTGVVATMTYPTAEAEASFCDSARRVIQAGEKYVTDHE